MSNKNSLLDSRFRGNDRFGIFSDRLFRGNDYMNKIVDYYSMFRAYSVFMPRTSFKMNSSRYIAVFSAVFRQVNLR